MKSTQPAELIGASPVFERPAKVTYAFAGRFREYVDAVTANWLLTAPAANPAMLEIFRDRDRKPARRLVPWAGEFAGKYLTECVQILRVADDRKLRAHVEQFVAELVKCQDADGYLGPWPRHCRLTGVYTFPDGEYLTWDAWGHYHIMLGLTLWHDDTGDRAAMACATRIADLLCQKFLGDKQPRLVDTGSTEKNLAPAHALTLLYQRTGDDRYLALAEQIVEEFAARDAEGKPLAGDYLHAPLNGVPFYNSPKPRWESLHPIMALAELHYITDRDDLRAAFEKLWWSMVETDRHNNGGFTAGEKAQGTPYHLGAIETCCTIAWIAMSVEMLRLTGDSRVADEIELSTVNSVLGLHSVSGRWVTYNTPMDGVRKCSAQDIVFQAREGSPDLNCCSVNGGRGLGMLSDWAVMDAADGLVLNSFLPMNVTTKVGRANVTLRVEGDYPRQPKVRCTVGVKSPTAFVLRVRVPYWSAKTTCSVNGKAVRGIHAGRYLAIDRTWAEGDVVELTLDFSPHFWRGDEDFAALMSIYRGPVLLTYDRRLNPFDPDEVPALDARDLKLRLLSKSFGKPEPWLAVQASSGKAQVVLCDFASAGYAGTPYRSWLPVKGTTATPFTAENPLRSARVKR